jgi:undecaprenyl-diphosphatase
MFVSVLRKDAGTAFILTAFLYAVLVSYSRLYLGVHYPSDLMVGAFIGTFSGWLFAEWYKRLYDYAGKRKGKQ